jgi:chemotaxis signal transduction protein
MFANIVSGKWAEATKRVEPMLELVVFDIDRISFGIPMTKINRVISNVFIGEDFSLTQDVEILDLHYRLSGIEISNPNAIAIFTGDNRQLYGIPIETVPILTSVPLDRIRTLPHDFRTTNPLGIASHVAVISDSTTELTIFILAG